MAIFYYVINEKQLRLFVCIGGSCLTHWLLGDICKFQMSNFQAILVNAGRGISNEVAIRWMSPDLTDDKSTLVLVMAWCLQAASHYLSQCWLRSMSSNGITRPQCVNVVDVTYRFNWLTGGRVWHHIYIVCNISCIRRLHYMPYMAVN